MTTQELREALSKFPRVPVADVPTPLHECPRLAAAIGVKRLFVKRDDLTGLAFGGNKARKFAFIFADALQQDADCVITGAASQSNHARQAAAAAAKLGMQAYLVNRHDHRARLGIQGNWLLDCLLGAEVRLTAPGVDQGQAQRQLEEELRAAGRRPYRIAGHAFTLGAIAYVECAVEIAEQLEAAGARADVVSMASGDGTQAGIALGARLLETGWRVIGYTPHKADARRTCESIATRVNEAAEALGTPLRLTADEIENRNDFVGEEYGIPTPAGLDATHLAARTEGLLLDPVYTSKALSGLIAAARSGEIGKNATVVFLHTGGAPALFAYQPELTAHGSYPVRVIENLAHGVL